MSPALLEDYADLAGSPEEATRRFNLTKSIDPFPEIQPSLLNSADIYDYVRMTGMLYPFYPDKVKSASYEAGIRGVCIWWDEKGEQHQEDLNEKGKVFTLNANSIAFVQIESFFRLPDYIALRFNLKITHVHRGILLGTGPLVDPGFVGRLLIPLHNLTTNPYRFVWGEGLIWIEFTKTSWPPPNSESRSNAVAVSRKGLYKGFPPNKKDLPPGEYLHRASQQLPIRSSIPDVGRESRESAKEAKEKVETVENRVKNYSILGGATLLLTILGLVTGTWSLIHEAWKTVSEAQHLIQAIKQEGIAQKVSDLQSQVDAAHTRTAETMLKLQQRIEALDAKNAKGMARSSVNKQRVERGNGSK